MLDIEALVSSEDQKTLTQLTRNNIKNNYNQNN